MTTTSEALHAYRTAGAEAQRFHRVLGLLPAVGNTIDLPMACAAAGLAPASAGELLAHLARHDLIITGPEGHRFASSAVRRHATRAAEQTDTPATRTRIQHRALDWLLTAATTAAALINPHRPPIDPPVTHPPQHPLALTSPHQARAFLRHRNHHLPAVLHLAQSSHPAAVPHLLHAFWDPDLIERDLRTWADDHHQGLHILANPSTAGDRLLRRRLLSARATALSSLLRFPAALDDCHEALSMARSGQDAEGVAEHLRDLGAVYHQACAHDLGRTYLSESLRAWSALGRRREAAGCGLLLAVVDLDLGASGADVLHRLRVAERDLLAEADPLGAARARAWQGRVLALDGLYNDATMAYRSAVEVFTAHGAVLWQGRVLSWTARVLQERGQAGQAAALYRRSAHLYHGRSPQDHALVQAALARLSQVAA
ncbi:hypothetical protein AB0O91_26505 [Kitasatospora sp. NPDC089797]|uniref:hypothetical protein n=1 Tax=Kitasatospora sp. NPDC089797 TaxID=3155298 RepID=UPI00343DA9D8